MSVDLVADVGNLRTKLALFQGDDLLGQASVEHGQDLRAAAARLCAGFTPRRAAACQVRPGPFEDLRAWCREVLHLELRALGADLPCPIPVEVPAPERVGADRLANAVWAARSYPQRALVVVDLGTAITFDVVSSAGAFVGGAIAAGLRMRAAALHQRTALLPEVALEGEAAPPALGTSTEEALRAGLFWGTVGLIDAVCLRLARELEEDPLVVATGGDAKLFAPHCPCIARVVPDLTLRGVHAALLAAA
ncbi:MAG: type III pantothenate kinase [Planctomycetota bacterium]